ncbi:predicted protein [Histoplasma capsulatum G186AR]|uniref:Uncharacterized protein n=1 Tax=Ajellomyces capsulatus (strain G186AR / H82 / ATCC MYA-2454 / RMSCC 2432) TaxID=447093 RepID=C0NQG9_AJECG|nr:uncharacterized protein HCBG_05757 [Histoplasma capsulatum G186AR]EEH06441.1 predicted protein [Histoplasma capsulatum G186AR]
MDISYRSFGALNHSKLLLVYDGFTYRSAAEARYSYRCLPIAITWHLNTTDTMHVSVQLRTCPKTFSAPTGLYDEISSGDGRHGAVAIEFWGCTCTCTSGINTGYLRRFSALLRFFCLFDSAATKEAFSVSLPQVSKTEPYQMFTSVGRERSTLRILHDVASCSAHRPSVEFGKYSNSPSHHRVANLWLKHIWHSEQAEMPGKCIGYHMVLTTVPRRIACNSNKQDSPPGIIIPSARTESVYSHMSGRDSFRELATSENL